MQCTPALQLASVNKSLRLDLSPSLFTISSAVRGFEKDGAGSVAALQSLGFVGSSPAQVADFLYDSKGRIPARQVGRFLTLWYANSSGRADGLLGHEHHDGEGGEETDEDRARLAALIARVRAEKAQCKAIMRAFLRRLDFADDTPVQALRRLLARTRMPMESRSAGALLKRFAERYVESQARAARRGTADGAPEYRFGPGLGSPASPSPSPSPSNVPPSPSASPSPALMVAVSSGSSGAGAFASVAAPAARCASRLDSRDGGSSSSRSLHGLRDAAVTMTARGASAAGAGAGPAAGTSTTTGEAVAVAAVSEAGSAGSTAEAGGSTPAVGGAGGPGPAAGSPAASAAATAAAGDACRASMDEGCISDAETDAAGFARLYHDGDGDSSAGAGVDKDGCARSQRRVLYGCNVAELSVESVFMVTYTIVILNTDMRHAGIKTKMTRQQFARKNASVPGLEAIPDSFWAGLFDELAVRGLPVSDAVPTAPVRHALAGAGPDPLAVSALQKLVFAARPTSAPISAAHAAAAAEAAATSAGGAHAAGGGAARAPSLAAHHATAAPAGPGGAPAAAVVRERANSAFRWVKASLAAAGSAVSSAAAAALPVAAAATSNLRTRSRSWFGSAPGSGLDRNEAAALTVTPETESPEAEVIGVGSAGAAPPAAALD